VSQHRTILLALCKAAGAHSCTIKVRSCAHDRRAAIWYCWHIEDKPATKRRESNTHFILPSAVCGDGDADKVIRCTKTSGLKR